MTRSELERWRWVVQYGSQTQPQREYRAALFGPKYTAVAKTGGGTLEQCRTTERLIWNFT